MSNEIENLRNVKSIKFTLATFYLNHTKAIIIQRIA